MLSLTTSSTVMSRAAPAALDLEIDEADDRAPPSGAAR